MERKRKVKIYLFLSFVILILTGLRFLLDDPNNFGERSVGLYKANLDESKVNDFSFINELTIEIKNDKTYEFSKKLPFIDRIGKWELQEEDLVINLLLINKNGSKDVISVCCDDNNEITFYCYLDKSANYKRIVFRKIR